MTGADGGLVSREIVLRTLIVIVIDSQVSVAEPTGDRRVGSSPAARGGSRARRSIRLRVRTTSERIVRPKFWVRSAITSSLMDNGGFATIAAFKADVQQGPLPRVGGRTDCR